MAQSEDRFRDTLEKHPLISIVTIFSTGFGLAFAILSFYYGGKIDDIKQEADSQVKQKIKDCENEIRIKVIEIQAQERERYYLKIEQNSVNGKLLEKTLELIDKKNEK